jgi:choline dehydrogenase
VVLLEAGPGLAGQADMPPDVLDASAPTLAHDWGYLSEPDPLGRRRALPRARLIGGCSATNGCFALRGSPADYDGWAQLGNPGWSFAEVLPFFFRLEADADYGDQWHGRNGPLPIRATRAPSSIRYRQRSSTPPARTACPMPPITTGPAPRGWDRCPATHTMECG